MADNEDPEVPVEKALEDPEVPLEKALDNNDDDGTVVDMKQKMTKMKLAIASLGAVATGLLVATIVLATTNNNNDVAPATAPTEDEKPDYGENPCFGMRPNFPNVQCLQDTEEIFSTGEQSGVNVTKGYNGNRNTTVIPITDSYREKGLCPVNVHWHVGAEHYSVGEFDEKGNGPIDFHEGRLGWQCRYYEENNPKFNNPAYDWKHCIGMTVGQTYEMHWPHSAAGACNTPWQYQTPFYDGVFCNLPEEEVLKLKPQDIASAVGVQSQTFVVVDDEDYFYPDLFSGMIVDEDTDHGVDLAIYTGSTTGTQRNNEICSPFSPITWQVDRKCHLISASSFDRLCEQMEQQADNLKDDLYAHGARELVKDMHAANNHQTRGLRKKPFFLAHGY
jgi:hypothetical protein